MYRAYIAASRRSDRSLEARVESARRASEIHKKRTGRALRVTEQDVVNEEMYEEEDDDLPMQYRRLTAHLNTGNADFNRRLSAYLTGQIATRTALDQVMAQSFYRQYPNAPQFNQFNPFASPYPSPLGPAAMTPQLQPQHQTGDSYRHAPYPMPMNPLAAAAVQSPAGARDGFQQQQQPLQQAYPLQSPSVAASSDVKPSLSSDQPENASSVTNPHVQTPLSSPLATKQPTASSSANANARQQQEQQVPPSDAQPPSSNAITSDPSISLQPSAEQSQVLQQPQPPAQTPMIPLPYQMNTNYGFNPQPYAFSPYNTTLPPESQLLVGPALNPMDPFTAALLAGGNKNSLSVPFYNYTPPTASASSNAPAKLKDVHPTYNSLTQTLSPSALEIAPASGGAVKDTSAPAKPASDAAKAGMTASPGISAAFDSGFEELFGSQTGQIGGEKASAKQNGGAATPGTESDLWNSFIDGNALEDIFS